MEGFVQLHRKIVHWEWYDSPKTKAVFLDLLLYAAHKDSHWRGYAVNRGQLITSIRKIAERNGLTEKSVREALKRLKKTKEITCAGAHTHTLITLCNFDIYHGAAHPEGRAKGQTKGGPTANEGRTNGDIQEDNKNIRREEEVVGAPSSSPVRKYLELYFRSGMARKFGEARCAPPGREEAIQKLVAFLERSGVTLEKYFEQCLASEFFGASEEQFMPKFDWFLDYDNATKVIEGAYLDLRSNRPMRQVDSNTSTFGAKYCD